MGVIHDLYFDVASDRFVDPRLKGRSGITMREALGGRIFSDQQHSMAVHYVRRLKGGDFGPTDLPGHVLTFKIQRRGETPKRGQISVEYQSEQSAFVDIAEGTLLDLQNALNEVTTIEAAGGVKVLPYPTEGMNECRPLQGRFLIIWNEQGARDEVVFYTQNVQPLAYVFSEVICEDSDCGPEQVLVYMNEQRLGHIQTFTAFTGSSINAQQTTTGDTGIRAVQRIYFEPLPAKAEWRLKIEGLWTDWLRHSAGESDVQCAIDAVAPDVVRVMQNIDCEWILHYNTDGAQALVEVEGNITPWNGYKGTIEWNTDLVAMLQASRLSIDDAFGQLKVTQTSSGDIRVMAEERIPIEVLHGLS